MSMSNHTADAIFEPKTLWRNVWASLNHPVAAVLLLTVGVALVVFSIVNGGGVPFVVGYTMAYTVLVRRVPTG